MMKNRKPQSPDRNMKVDRNRSRPENKDNLDSREGVEQLIKGTHVTHNKKSPQNEKSSFKRKRR